MHTDLRWILNNVARNAGKNTHLDNYAGSSSENILLGSSIDNWAAKLLYEMPLGLKAFVFPFTLTSERADKSLIYYRCQLEVCRLSDGAPPFISRLIILDELSGEIFTVNNIRNVLVSPNETLSNKKFMRRLNLIVDVFTGGESFPISIEDLDNASSQINLLFSEPEGQGSTTSKEQKPLPKEDMNQVVKSIAEDIKQLRAQEYQTAILVIEDYRDPEITYVLNFAKDPTCAYGEKNIPGVVSINMVNRGIITSLKMYFPFWLTTLKSPTGHRLRTQAFQEGDKVLFDYRWENSWSFTRLANSLKVYLGKQDLLPEPPEDYLSGMGEK